jgi:SAM-dependent methyltransferase
VKREDLIRKIREEAARFEPPSPVVPLRADDLLQYDGHSFVVALYRNLVRREPEAAGLAHYLDLVKRLPKPLILYFFSRSQEARQQGTKIEGVYCALIKSYLTAAKESLTRLYPLHFFRSLPEKDTIDYFRFYIDFENRFRGFQEDIERGLEVYVSLFEGVNDPIVDLGSGRGEWLRLLTREGLNVTGIDINPHLIEECDEEGLQVIKSDAFKFLRNATDSAFGAVTAFHLIEHLDPDQRLLFLREIYRVLKPGGLLLLETPNPRNILVSAGDFFRDPEHVRPIFPDTLSFTAKFVGFPDARCYFFNKDRTALISCADTEFRDLQSYVEVSRDFALIARKW